MPEIRSNYEVTTRGIGLPDYAQAKPVGSVPVGPIFTSTDIGELAARLGSIVTYDRRGNVVWLDNFDDGINKWLITHNDLSLTHNVKWSADYSRNGSFSCMIQSPSVTGKYAGILRSLPYLIPSRFGLELNISYYQYWKDLEVYFHIRDGTYEYRARIKYSVSPETNVYYFDEFGNWQDTGLTIDVPGDAEFFFPIKLVVDFPNKEYERLLISEHVVDLSGKKLAGGGCPGLPQLYIEILLSTRLNNNAIGYVDDVIVTQNEPANL